MRLEGLLDGKGRALDLGCGDGRYSLVLGEYGYSVVSVDRAEDKIKTLTETKKDFDIQCITTDIRDFEIIANSYAVVIASNIFYFFDNESVITIFKKIYEGLVPGGKFYVTLLGPNDEWKGKEGYSFFTYEEATSALEKTGFKIYFRSTEEGQGAKLDGSLKYWNIHRFICIK